MKVYQIVVALLLSLVCQKTTSQSLTYTILWDRFWLARNITDLTLNVNLGDEFVFVCQVNPNNENAEDVFENLIRLQVNQCNATGEMAMFIDSCTVDTFDITVPISTPNLVNRQGFEVGQVYYFTSFSDGTQESAENTETVGGGGCSREPPLILTVSVVPRTTSVMMSSTTSSSFVTSTTMTSSSMLVTATSVPTTSAGTNTPSTSPPDQGSIEGAAGHLIPLNCFIILLFATISLIL